MTDRVAQPTERMTAEQLIVDLDASYSRERALALQYKAVKQRAEFSAALVRELAQTLEYAIEDLRNGWTPRTGLVPHTEALLSREDVKKVLEE